jgi:3-isopropylmalate dehydrogenase
MMCRYSLQLNDIAERIDRAVASVISQGLRTSDIASNGKDENSLAPVGTTQMGDAVIAALGNE